jgi:hypothetical protein
MRRSGSIASILLMLTVVWLGWGIADAAHGRAEAPLFEASLRNGDYGAGKAVPTMDPDRGGSPDKLGIVDSAEGVTFTSTEVNGASNALINWEVGADAQFRATGTIAFAFRADRAAFVGGELWGDNLGYTTFANGQGTISAAVYLLENGSGTQDDQVVVTWHSWHNNIWFDSKGATLEFDRWYSLAFTWGGPHSFELWVNGQSASSSDLPPDLSLPWGQDLSATNVGLGGNHQRGYQGYTSAAGVTYADFKLYNSYVPEASVPMDPGPASSTTSTSSTGTTTTEVSSCDLLHIYCLGMQLGWFRLGLGISDVPDFDLIDMLTIATGHAQASRIPFQNFVEPLQSIINMVKSGDTRPAIAGAFDAWEPGFRAQLEGTICRLQPDGTEVLPWHIYCLGMQLGWFRLGLHPSVADSFLIGNLTTGTAHAQASRFPFQNYVEPLQSIINMVRSGDTRPAIAGVFDAWEPGFRAQLENLVCNLGTGGAAGGATPAGPPSLVVVTSVPRLLAKYGDAGLQQIQAAIDQLGGRLLDVTSDQFRQVDAAIEAQGRQSVTALLIVGNHDVVPFSELPNPAWSEKDHDILYTDDVYGDFDHDAKTIIDVPTGRIPDGGDLELLLTQLGSPAAPSGGSFALAMPVRPWASAIAGIIGAPILWSPPTLHTAVPSASVPAAYDYFMIHGSLDDTSTWVGETPTTPPTYPQAFKAYLAKSRGIVFAGCCYGAYTIGKNPANSISLAFLKSGARCFVGSTAIHYSSTLPGEAGVGMAGGPFHRAFLTAVTGGQNPFQAFFDCKRSYGARAVTGPERKLMHAFVYYGRP